MDDSLNSKKIKAAALLSAGYQQGKVAEELGISKRTLQRWIKEPGFKNLRNNVAVEVMSTATEATAKRLIQDIPSSLSGDERKNLISRECELLDIALATVIPMIESGSLQAIDRLIRISERRCKLLGLDQPRMEVLDAIACLSQYGIITDFQTRKVHQVLDESDAKLAQIGLNPNLP